MTTREQPSIGINTYQIATLGQGLLHAMARPCPETLKQDIAAIKSSGINRVVSLLETDESKQLMLQNEEVECLSLGLTFIRFPISDFGIPDPVSLPVFIEQIYQDISAGMTTVVHCRGGIGRTGLICCCLLIRHGLAAKDAIALMRRQRGCEVPETPDQLKLVLNFRPQ